MIKLLFSDLIDIIRGTKKAVAVILLSVSITTAVILSFVSIVSDSFNSLQDIDYDSRFYNVPVASAYSLPRMKAVDDLFFGEYPQINNIYPFAVCSYKLDGSVSQVTGNIFANSTEFDGYPVVDSSFCSFLYIPSPNVIEGRWFTKQEILNGDDVVVLSRPWLEEFYPDSVFSINGEFRINDIPYTIVGITNGIDDTLAEYSKIYPNYIPYRALNKHETDNSGFRIFEFQIFIEFEKPLTKNQRLQIAESFSNDNSSKIPMSNLDISGTGHALNILLVFVIAVAMIFVCALNIMGLYQSVLKMNIYRYMVYKVCGATNKFIKRTLRFTTACFTVFSGTVGCVIYFAISKLVPETVFQLWVDWYIYPIVVLFMTFFMQLIINPMIQSISKKQPIDRHLWR